MSVKIIAHRGLLYGPNPKVENTLEQHRFCWSQDITTEADLWVQNGKFYFGHDKPQYEIPEGELMFNEMVILHCKNFDALMYCTMEVSIRHYFWHQNDDYTLTQPLGLIWTYPKSGLPLGKKSIPVILNPWEVTDESHRLWTVEQVRKCYGVCTDHVFAFEGLLNLANNE